MNLNLNNYTFIDLVALKPYCLAIILFGYNTCTYIIHIVYKTHPRLVLSFIRTTRHIPKTTTYFSITKAEKIQLRK